MHGCRIIGFEEEDAVAAVGSGHDRELDPRRAANHLRAVVERVANLEAEHVAVEANASLDIRHGQLLTDRGNDPRGHMRQLQGRV